MVGILYNLIFIPFGLLLLRILSYINPKVRRRESAWRHIFTEFLANRKPARKTVWFHAASMGEFEQAKPVIELLKEHDNSIEIVCTFYSPSGYENQKKYKYADSVLYMPFDSKARIERFVRAINPTVAVVVRYEIWFNYLHAVQSLGIPFFLICGTRPGSTALAKPVLRSYAKQCYSCFTSILTVGKEHSDYFRSIGLGTITETMTDTRFDRICRSVESSAANPILPRSIFPQEEKILVAGSTWEPDESVIIDAVAHLRSNAGGVRCVFVPHEPTDEHLDKLESRLSSSIRLSSVLSLMESGISLDLVKREISGKDIVVDSIGKLLRLYSIADFAYIGGAFGAGVHSVTEPAGYGIPLATGSGYHNSPDAANLVAIGALVSVSCSAELALWLHDMVSLPDSRERAGTAARDYVYSGSGSSPIVAERIIKLLKQ